MPNSPTPPLSDRCSFDHVYNQVVRPFFDKLNDGRAFNQSYSLSNCLRAGFSLYSLKSPSMLQFRTMAQMEEYNLGSVYGVGSIPADTQFRQVLDEVPVEELRQGFGQLFNHFKRLTPLRKAYHVWQDFMGLSVDGVEHFRSKKVSC